MNRRTVNWLIILTAIVIAVANPLYRYLNKQPILTLGLDLKGGVEVLLEAVPEDGSTPSPDQVSGAMMVVRNRVDPQGTKEISLSQVGLDRILLQVPGEKNPDSVISVIGDTALLEFLNTGEQSLEQGLDINQEGSTERKEEYAKYETIVTGADLVKADVSFNNQNRPIIRFKFKSSAADKFGQFTNDHVNQYLTVVLDGKVLTSPVINSPIWGGEGIIEGRFTLEEANRIVTQLNAGALPVPLSILSSSIVGPTLGQESIDASLLAGIIGFIIVLLFMIVAYRLPGLVANAALIIYVVLMLGFLSLFNATMTLPGIAGFLLSIGMAIDGNIIIFERLKEEIRWGKTLIAAMEAAFSRAWAAILDGNLVTMLAAAVLYFYGSGPIKGFAVTLFIGNIIALFSAVFVTRQFMDLAMHNMLDTKLYASPVKNVLQPIQILRERKYFGFVEKTPIWVAISTIIILLGLGAGAMYKSQTGSFFNLGIDFTGGDKLIMETKEPMPVEGQALLDLVQKYADGEAVAQVDLNNPKIVTIRMRVKSSGETEKEKSDNRLANLQAMKEELGNAYGGFSAAEPANPQIIEHEHVGPTVGKEMVLNGIWALLWGCVLIAIYIYIRYLNWAMGTGGILAIFHDVFLTLAFVAMLKLEINGSFIAVILTIAGYSINDTVIVYDRVRENLRNMGHSGPFAQLCNLSISQTFLRSLSTIVSVVIMIVALLAFGGDNIRGFMLAMLIGIISGAYSSIYIAVPLMLAVSRGNMKLAENAPIDFSPPAKPEELAVVSEEQEDAVSRTIRKAVEQKERTAKKQRRR